MQMTELALDLVGDRIEPVQYTVQKIEKCQRNQPVDRFEFHETVELRFVQIIGRFDSKGIQFEFVIFDSKAIVPILRERGQSVIEFNI